MKKLLKTGPRKSIMLLGTIVDVYSLYQIIKQIPVKVSDLTNNPWVLLFVIVTGAIVFLLIYYKLKDERDALLKRIDDDKAGVTDYRKRAREEFIRLYEQNDLLTERINKLYWQLEEIKNFQLSSTS